MLVSNVGFASISASEASECRSSAHMVRAATLHSLLCRLLPAPFLVHRLAPLHPNWEARTPPATVDDPCLEKRLSLLILW